MDALATKKDYASRWGEPADEERLETLLSDASAFLASELARHGKSVDPEDGLQSASLRRICCRLVHDQLSQADSMPGVSQASWAASPFSGSYTLANPSGKLFLYRDEKRELGIGGPRVGSVAPRVWSEDDVPDR